MSAPAAVRIFVPCDAAALGMGADQTARAILAEAKHRGSSVELIRNGSRGLLWLEPLVEVEVAGTRVASGDQRPRLFWGIRLFVAGNSAAAYPPRCS